jgi:hypothetical protein
MEGMIDLRPDKDLLVLTPGAVRAYFVFSHLSADRRQIPNLRTCRQSRNKYIHRLIKVGRESCGIVMKMSFRGMAGNPLAKPIGGR